MKKVTVLAILVAALTSTLHAQVRRPHPQRKPEACQQRQGHNKMQQAAQRLKLTDDQKKQAKAINEDFRKKMQELNKKEDITVKQQRDQKEALAKEHKAKLEALLTQEQKAEKEKMIAEKKQEHEARFEKGIEKMKEKIGLTEEQVKQIKANHEANSAKLKAIKDDKTLSRTDRKEKLEQLRESIKTEKQKILTEEQKKKLEEFKKNKHLNKPQETK